MMPPQGMPRPDEATLDAFATSLERSIDRVALTKPNPGRSPLHRLNRSEYAAAVRDVLALDVDATALLPADDEANGFDNIADVLKVSPSLLEQYLTAARRISALAVGDPGTTPVGTVYRVPPDRAQEDHIEGLPLGTRGGILVRHNFPLDATYEFNVVLLQNIVGYVPGLSGRTSWKSASTAHVSSWLPSAAPRITSCRTRTSRRRRRRSIAGFERVCR
jgi:hypothetical protein